MSDLGRLREQVEEIERANREAGYDVPESALICVPYPEARALIERVERAEAAVARVEALAAEWDRKARVLSDLRRVRQLRAALADTTAAGVVGGGS